MHPRRFPVVLRPEAAEFTAATMRTDLETRSFALREPCAADAAGLWRLVRDGGSLDLNSPYVYLLICTDHAATSVVATDEHDEPVGFVAAYRPPPDPDAAFVWQIGVAERARGQGLAKRLLKAMLAREANRDAQELTATVTPDNDASLALFRSVAPELSAQLEEHERFPAEVFPHGHEPEVELRIGPLDARAALTGDLRTLELPDPAL
jgi:L-2,4-diaminobutyric acid acetyltransferase